MESKDELETKLKELRSHVPFVERMITKLSHAVKSSNNPRSQNQLQRLHGLHSFLTKPMPKAPKMEMLQRMEAVLQSMKDKVQKAESTKPGVGSEQRSSSGNTAGLENRNTSQGHSGTPSSAAGQSRTVTSGQSLSRGSTAIGQQHSSPGPVTPHGHVTTQRVLTPQDRSTNKRESISSVKSVQPQGSSHSLNSGSKVSSLGHGTGLGHATAPGHSSGPGHGSGNRTLSSSDSSVHKSSSQVSRQSSLDRHSVRDPGRHEVTSREQKGYSNERQKEIFGRSSDSAKYNEKRRDHHEDDRSKTKESKPIQLIDLSRSFDRSKSDIIDPRMRSAIDRENEKNRGTGSGSREREKEKNREPTGYVRYPEGDYGNKTQRQHSSLEVVRPDEGKHSSKRNSLLDLPMPPCAPNQKMPQSLRDMSNVNQGSKEKFDSSREKLQKLFGITGESSRAQKKGDSPSGSVPDLRADSRSSWRDEVRARASSFKEPGNVTSDHVDERLDPHYGKHRSQSLEDSTNRSFHQPPMPRALSQGQNPSVHVDHERHRMLGNTHMSSPHSAIPSQSSPFAENRGPPPTDSPMSPPSESPVHSPVDTPMSPDQEASFSPVLDSEVPSPVKTIPLQNLQEKGVDLEAIKKALAQIQSNEKLKSGSGHSYRYEDFVGPAAKDDEPYDPEEVWKSHDIESTPSRHTTTTAPSSTMLSSHRDVDLRQIPQAFVSRGQERSGQSSHHGTRDIDSRKAHHGARDIDSRKVMLGHVSQIPLPQKSFGTTHVSQPSVTQSSPGSQSGMRSNVWDQDIRSQRPADPRGGRNNSGDVDMRFQQFRPHQPPVHQSQPHYASLPASHSRSPPLPVSQVSLPHQPPLPKAHPPLPAIPPPPLPESPQPPQPPLPPLPKSPPPQIAETTDKDGKKETPSRLDHIRSRIAQNAGEFIRPGQRGVAASQMEKYKLKRQTSSDIKSPPHSPFASKDHVTKKSESNTKSPSSVTVLDILLPEEKTEKSDSANQASKDPRKPLQDVSTPVRDPRLSSLDSSAKDSESQVKDPRLSSATGSSLNRNSKLQTVRDPRQDLGKYIGNAKDTREDASAPSVSEGMIRENKDLRKNSSTSESLVRDPRQDPGLVHRDPRQEHSITKKDPRQEHAVSTIKKDPRQEHAGSIIKKDPRQDLGTSKVDPMLGVSRDPRQDFGSVGAGRIPRQEHGLLNRDPRQDHGLINRDPRQDHGPLNRDPRQDHGPLNRDPRHDLVQMKRDPRQDHGPLNRDPRQDHCPVNRDPRQDFGTPNREIWQDHGNFMNTPNVLAREPRQDISPYMPIAGGRDPRRDSGPYPNIPGPQYRDPRLLPRPDRPPGQVWPPTSQPLPLTPNFPPLSTPPPPQQPINREVAEVNPSLSASGSLIGQSFTCLMMRGLPPFVNSHHIYRFFEEYILRDISIELDNNYNCKGTAYIHFPSHASAREALEKMNGYLLHGSPIALRICTVGILRQAKNAYEQLNRDREARLGLPERPRGNANPFYKPKPKEPLAPPPPIPKPVSVTPPVEKENKVQIEKSTKIGKEGNVESSPYSSLCGVKVASATSSLNFKIPKIRKDDPAKLKAKKQESGDKGKKHHPKDSSVGGKTSKIESKVKKNINKPLLSESSESDFEVPLDRAPKVKKKRRLKKLVIDSDSDSEPEQKTSSDAKPQKKVKPPPVVTEASKETSASEQEDSDGEGEMVIDESVHSDHDYDETESEVSSLVSDETAELPVLITKKEEKKQIKKNKDKGAPRKTKPVKVKPIKPKKNIKKKVSVKKTKASKKKSQGFIYESSWKDMELQSGVGIKLTRHTQGELEELIPLQNKLKVTIPVPHKLVITLFDDDKTKKRGTKRRAPDTPVIPVQIPEPTNAVIVLHSESSQDESSDIKEEMENIAKKVMKKKAETKKKVPAKKKEIPKPILKDKMPGSTRGIMPPVLGQPKDQYWTPTNRRGKKRKCHTTEVQRVFKKAKRTSFDLSHFTSWSKEMLNTAIIKSGTTGKSTEIKRSHSSPAKAAAASKKPRLDDDELPSLDTDELKFEQDTSQGSQSGLDLFDNSNISDEVSDLTHLTPSLLEVEPTICNALPDASVLANVLSPPHVPPQSNDNSVSSVAELVEEGAATKLPVPSTNLCNKPCSESKANKAVQIADTTTEVTKDSKKGKDKAKPQGTFEAKSFDKESEAITVAVSQLVESLDNSTMGEASPTEKGIDKKMPQRETLGTNSKEILDISKSKEDQTAKKEKMEDKCKKASEMEKGKEVKVCPENLQVTGESVKLSECKGADISETKKLELEQPKKSVVDEKLHTVKEEVTSSSQELKKSNDKMSTEEKSHEYEVQGEGKIDKTAALKRSGLDQDQQQDTGSVIAREEGETKLKDESGEMKNVGSALKEEKLNSDFEIHLASDEKSVIEKEEKSLVKLQGESQGLDQLKADVGLKDAKNLENAKKDEASEQMKAEVTMKDDQKEPEAKKSIQELGKPMCQSSAELKEIGSKEAADEPESDKGTLASEKLNLKSTVKEKTSEGKALEKKSEDKAQEKILEGKVQHEKDKGNVHKESGNKFEKGKSESIDQEKMDLKPSDGVASGSVSTSKKNEKLLTSEPVLGSGKFIDAEREGIINTSASNSNKADLEEVDDGDDAASIGKMSSSSFVDDASVVSSEGRELKTPDSGISKKGKRVKSAAAVPPECRRVTRGSLVEPRVAEVTEWDDGGVVDLFQCDLCDYVGRHVANHLVNYHSERELPCEFKKEDFGPVIRDHVGPPLKVEGEKEEPVPKLNFNWIPKAMTFDSSVTCKNCDYFSNSRFDLIYHCLEHSPKSATNAYHCRLCNYMSEVKEDFYNHVSSHTGEYRYTCDLCGHKTYKKLLLQDHHKNFHQNQSQRFSVSRMIEEDGWLYIHVCKICMFVRISLEAAEQHVQHRHGGKADVHKANMSRVITLHSEMRKPGESDTSVIQRLRFKGKKKRKGKKGPDLEVFVGGEDEDDVEEEVEEKAKQLVDRIALNIHTTTSAQQAQKRMSLLNTIFQKLDEKEKEDSEKEKEDSESLPVGSSQDSSEADPEATSTELTEKDKNKVDVDSEEQSSKSKESNKEKEIEVTSTVLIERTKGVIDPNKEGITQELGVSKTNEVCGSEKEEKMSKEIGELPKDDSSKKSSFLEDTSCESDTESTVSALDAAFDDEIVMGSGSLQDTIRKLSAKLDEVAKENAVNKKEEEGELKQQQQDAQIATQSQQRQSLDSRDDDDSDSDNLVICEDIDVEAKEEEDGSFTKRDGGPSKDKDPSDTTKPTLQSSIQSILREASVNPQVPKMPQLRIRPAHQLIDPRFRIVSKTRPQPTSPRRQGLPSPIQQDQQLALFPQPGRKPTTFVCCVPECHYSSNVHSNLLKHIVITHGPFKCIASGCQYVTKSREYYSIHMDHVHPNLNFMVCPFLCKIGFNTCSELLDHLSHHQQTLQSETVEDVEEEDNDEPGFLRIESVGTMDPAAASQMFGEDYDSSTTSCTPSQTVSPLKITVAMSTSPTSIPRPIFSDGNNPSLPLAGFTQNEGETNVSGNRLFDKTTLSSVLGGATVQCGTNVQSVMPVKGSANILSGTSVQSNMGVQSGMLFSGRQDMDINTSAPGNIQSTLSPVHMLSVSSPIGLTTFSQPAPITCIATTKGSESLVTTTKLEPPLTSPSKSPVNSKHIEPGSSEVQKKTPSVVTLDEDEGEGEQVENLRVKKHPPVPGLATLPKNPPTVPIQEIFKDYQPVTIFKILTTKLAPEVFKCMYKGCVFADDEPETFLQHVSVHGKDFRCCYCLMLLPTAQVLVDHILTEHSNCQFQCKYCLYRAFTKIYMGVHLKNFHPYDEPRYIKVGTIRTGYPPSPPIDQFVRPYRCNYQGCQYRTVDSEAFRLHVQQTHGQFVILSCDFCHKHLHVIPLIDHMREHQMHAHQCPYCLHGDAERERLLGHLLNCHSGRRGKVLVRKHNEDENTDGASKIEEISSPPPAPPQVTPSQKLSPDVKPNGSPHGGMLKRKASESPVSSASAVTTTTTVTTTTATTTIAMGKEVNPPSLEGRRISRSLSRELGEADSSSSRGPVSMNDDGSGQPAEKTGLSGHALYRCGNDGCEYTSLTQVELREHLQVCDLTLDSTTKCYHCGKQCRHLSTLFDHLRVHGPKRYCCGVTGCDYRATMAHYFKNHMKQIHHCSGFKHLIKDPKNKDPETQEFVVYPKDAVLPIKEGHKKRKNEYSFEDIPRVPRPHISYQDLKCYHCQFVSKVRLNLVKHLRLHERYPDGIPERLYISGGLLSPIPFKQPVNPVPCLDRKELMFDKMMNLAGSSFESKKKREDDLRTKNPIPPDEYEKLPKLVSEERLHSCGVRNCNYVSCDDMMLKYHIRSLHTDMTSFPCPHCVDQTITVEKMSSHFKLHGDRLYRCGWCPYISSRHNMVERHMKEKHQGKKPFDFIIREPQDPDAPKKADELQPEEVPIPLPPPPPALEPPQWQCGLCKFSSVTQQEMVNHTSFKHAIKSQYKCGYCSVRSSVRTSFDAHFAAKHPNQAFRVLCMYYRLDSEDIEPINQGDGQNSHEPIWRRNDPERRRQIRGIVVDDPEGKKTWLKKKVTGTPVKGEFTCPVCLSFKTVCVATFRSHLCREAEYDRYQCVECGISNALLPTLQRHYQKMHHASFTTDCYLNLPIEEDKEAWVESIINHQQHMIKAWQDKGGADGNQDPVPSTHQGSPSKTSLASRVSSVPASTHPTGEVPPQQGGVVLHDSGSERGRFTCDTCGSECRTAAGLKSHTTAMHQTRFKCHYCPFASNSEDAVKQHCSFKHPKLQNEALDVSQRVRAQKSDDGPSVDSQVTKAESSQEMNNAEGTETSKESVEGKVDKVKSMDAGKSYPCPFCPFTTNASYTLTTHKRKKHADTRMFQCNHCSSRFSSNIDALRHHKWKHQQLKPDIVHLDKVVEELPAVEASDEENTDTSFSLPVPESTTKRSPRHSPGPEPKKYRGKKSTWSRSASPLSNIESGSPLSSSLESLQSVSTAKGATESLATYSCCHCNHRSSKEAMEDHMKKQHRDMPYQVRKEEGDKIFTEVYIYKCIHCVVESISHAQSMDHWIQNHALLEFKYQMVLRHSGEVSNQVVTSTTADKDPAESGDADSVSLSTGDARVTTSDSGVTSDVASSTVITSSSESVSTSIGAPLAISKRRGSNVEMMSPHRYSFDTEEEEQSEVGDGVDEEGDFRVQTSSDVENQDIMYKCGYCKKSSTKLQEIEAHLNKTHPDKPSNVKKLKREVFDQLYRAEYECGYCGEKGRNAGMTQHLKSIHPNLPSKFSRVPKSPRENICFRCEVCSHVVKNLNSIRNHLRRHHPEANEYTFTKLTLGSPMRFPIKQPYKCNYCGDVGETLQEMHDHHAFLHSHLEYSIKNLRDEALSSVHTPSTSLNSGELPSGSVLPSPVSASVSLQDSEESEYKVSVKADPSLGIKNTARKSFSSSSKRTVAMKSTSRLQSVASTSGTGQEPSGSVCGKELNQQPDNLYACVDLGAGVPVKLTVEKLGELINLQPQVVVKDVKSLLKFV